MALHLVFDRTHEPWDARDVPEEVWAEHDKCQSTERIRDGKRVEVEVKTIGFGFDPRKHCSWCSRLPGGLFYDGT